MNCWCGGFVSRTKAHLLSLPPSLPLSLPLPGEVLDVDGITGGYNFMNCWCGGFVAGQSMARRVLELGEGGREGGMEGGGG